MHLFPEGNDDDSLIDTKDKQQFSFVHSCIKNSFICVLIVHNST